MTHIDRNHPVRAILDAAAAGNAPTKAFLDQMLIDVSDEQLPEGQTLNKFRTDINQRAREIAAFRAQGDHERARRHAADAASELADRMTPTQRALKSNETQASRADVDAAVAAAFRN